MQEATAARHTLPVLSPSYLAAEYTQPEWAAAFARDPQGRERALIPVRVTECHPDGLLAQVIYADLAGRAGTISVDLEKLPPEAGAELLRHLGVQGTEKDLQAASRERGGHGLALTLLGTYLRDLCGGDVRRRNEIAVLDETVGIEGSLHARNMMAAYESSFGAGPDGRPQLQLLHLLGLFDRPAEPAALAALRAEPEIPGLTEGIGAGDETAWKAALAAFFDHPWGRPSSRLTPADRAWLVGQAGFHLRALGRLPEAVQPMRAGLDAQIAEESWKQAAIAAGNLSELTLTLGDVAGAVAAAEESVELADRSGDAFMRMVNRTTLADALHQAGRWQESEALETA